MRGLLPYILTALLLLPVGASHAAQAQDQTQAQTLIIIGNASVPDAELDSAELMRIFMLKRTVWPDGTAIVPVNREARSQERQYFSKQVLGRSMRSLAAYWNQMQFKGFMPPVVQESDAAVAAFVRNVPGAVGYIVADKAPAGVRVLGEIR